MMNSSKESLWPDPPIFSEEDLRYSRDTGDYRPLLFEWYKFAGALCCCVAHIMPDSPAYKAVAPRHYYILTGLLNRCSRLMLSNVVLSHEGKFGETTAIVDRCIFESAVKVIWLCHNASEEEFGRYLADGLKTEIEFKAKIKKNISQNGGSILTIEARMLRSIENHIRASGLSESEIVSTKKQRDLAAMIDGLGFDRLLYITAQKIGSHHTHGTWPSLLFHYLQERDDAGEFRFGPDPGPCGTHINQFMFIPLIVLQATRAFAEYMLEDAEGQALITLLEATNKEILSLYAEAGENLR